METSDARMSNTEMFSDRRAGHMSGHTGKGKKQGALRTWLLLAAAVMLVMSASMGAAWAYFTTYTAAKGGMVLHMGHEEKVRESYKNWKKTINIQSTEDSRPVYIRARGYYAGEGELSYSSGSGNWEMRGDWMYYTRTLNPGKSLEDSGDELVVEIPVPSNEKDKDTFNVIVVYETMEAIYGPDPASTDPLSWDDEAVMDRWENDRIDTTRRTGRVTARPEEEVSDR